MPNTRFSLAQPTLYTQAFGQSSRVRSKNYHTTGMARMPTPGIFLIADTQYFALKGDFFSQSNPSQKRDPDRSRSSLAIPENHGVIC